MPTTHPTSGVTQPAPITDTQASNTPENGPANEMAPNPPALPLHPNVGEDNWMKEERTAAMEQMDTDLWTGQHLERVTTGFMQINRNLNQALDNLEDASNADRFKDIF